MVFSSMLFLFIFLPVLLLVYFLIPEKFRSMRNIVLLVFSLLFYAANEPFNIVVMIVSVFLNYGLGIAIEKTKSQGLFVFLPCKNTHNQRRLKTPLYSAGACTPTEYNSKYPPPKRRGTYWPVKKLVVWLAVFVNLGILIYFKYTNFICDTLTDISGITLAVKKIVMPIGISFYTFQGMSYVLDIYFGNAKAQKNPFNVMLYISLFPQLVAGPIVRYETVEKEISQRHENENEIAQGISQFMIGFAKKIIIANEVGKIADMAFGESNLTILYSWLGIITYTLQIYFDFSAYSDMAIGLGKIFGFHFPKNFDYPYTAESITDFWRRWHISLSTWFRDYLYIPLGGNRCKKIKHIRNIMAVWLATGIWHGASWNFIFWGLYYGVILIIEKEFLGKILKKLPKAARHIYTIFIVIIGFVFFRADTLGDAFNYIGVMFGGGALYSGNDVILIMNNFIIIVFGIIGSMPVYKLFDNAKNRPALKFAYCTAVFLAAIMFLTGSTFNPFIYFRF